MKNLRTSINWEFKNGRYAGPPLGSLLKETGKSFDMSPDTLILNNLFSMALHGYQEAIGDIVTSATKELSVEKGLTEVGGVWRDLKFTTHR